MSGRLIFPRGKRTNVRRADQVGSLFDFAVSRPDGFTAADVTLEFGWPRNHFFGIARRLRAVLDDDDANLVCTPQGKGRQWLYQLTGDPEEARTWQNNRVRDLEARLATSENVALSLTHATDSRTVSGRKARKIANTLGYLRKELAYLDSGAA
jgi:hypothetical protein